MKNIVNDGSLKYFLTVLPIVDAVCDQCDFKWKHTPNNDKLCRENKGKHCDPDVLKGVQPVYVLK